jgi:pimeloyl-ACP methyl ester carboxylesterase
LFSVEKRRVKVLKETFFNTGIVNINFAESPKSGPPMLLLHGLPGHWQEFLPIMPTLCLQWHCYALDSRGQGKSGRTPGQYKLKHYSVDVEQFLRQRVDEPAVLFGLSAGGAVALDVATKCPERVRAVILGDSPIDLDMVLPWMESEEFKYQFSAYHQLAGSNLPAAELSRRIADLPVQAPGQNVRIRYGDLPGMDAIQIQQLAITLSQMDPGVLEYHAEGRPLEFLEGFDLNQLLRQIKCPVLLLQGNPALGGMMTNNIVEHVQSLLPGVMHVSIDKDHGLGMDTWDVSALLRAVVSFLETV